MVRTLRVVALCLLCWLYDVDGYANYKAAIPNGESVGHPCKPNYMWKGVGHRNQLGGGNRNPFGNDFAEAGHKWTKALCEKDSDGDGETNGFELGDPDCTWTEGTAPDRTIGITHPGVCTPYGDAKCQGKNDWVSCEYEEFSCPPTEAADVMTKDIRFPDTPVPAEETTYRCMKFVMPNETDYHLIAYEPIIANENVMHHIVLYGCDLDAPFNEDHAVSPYECGMGPGAGCFNFLGIWSVGTVGHCLHENFGFRFGQTKYKVMAMEFHWNNPQKKSDYTDSSGLKIYYTPNKRTHDAGLLMLGQVHLKIAPGLDTHSEKAVCSSDCTSSAMNNPIYVTSAFNHMHYMGRSQRVELIRNGTKVRDITNEAEYSYDSPKVYKFDTPVELLPGDQLETTCIFSSKNKEKTVYYGDGTSDEMCFSFLWFYPAEAMSDSNCFSWKGLQYCSRTVMGKGIEECNPFTARHNDETLKGLMKKVRDECKIPGECFPECKEAIKEAKKHACLKGGDVTDMFNEVHLPGTKEGLEFLVRFLACDQKLIVDSPIGDDKDVNSAANPAVAVILYALTLATCVWIL